MIVRYGRGELSPNLIRSLAPNPLPNLTLHLNLSPQRGDSGLPVQG